MSGHSKWKQIKRQKGVADVKKGKVFSQISKMITIAAKNGGDPDFNPSLRIAIEKAKKENMPADNIEKAIKKGTGELEGSAIEEVLYEAYGPGGVALIIEATTDNSNRTVSEIKHILSRSGGRIGEAGSVKWMFDHFGYLEIDKRRLEVGESDLESAIIDSGAEDFCFQNNIIIVYTKPTSLYKTKDNLEKKGIRIDETGFEWKAKNKVKNSDEKINAQIEKLFEELEFKSLIGKIPAASNQGPAARQPHPTSSSSLRSDLRAVDGAPHSSLSLRAHPSESKTRLASPLPNITSPIFKTTDLDHQVESVLHKMSETGVLVDRKFLDKLGKNLKDKLIKLEQEIYSNIGHQINLNSPKQLAVILFDELKLPVIKKTKTGRSTNEETLHELVNHHPVVRLLLQYRQLFKLISTYVEALPKAIRDDKRIHSTFNVEGAATGRISSQDPNLQNIPVRGETGGEIRKAFIASGQEDEKRKALGVFIAPKGKVLLAADYSQIELRILAHLADDPGLKKAFVEGLDIHLATASRIFNKQLSGVTKQERGIGKTINFATLYGQGAHALSRQLGIDYQTARTYIEEYFEQFPKVRAWKEKILTKARECGYVETLWGRKRYIPELSSNNRAFQAFGERAAVNHPVQGTAADMIKEAMVEIDKLLGNKNKQCQMILQVHDELLFECHHKEVESTARMVKEKMENGWTPEEIAERIKTENGNKQVVSFKLIYNWLDTPFGEPHRKYLASKQSRWRRRRVGKKVIIKDRVFIENRPAVINKRRRLKDFEADVLGSLKSEKARIAGVVDRKAKYLNLKKVPRLREAVIAYNRMLKAGNARSCTIDNGPENASWKRLRIPTYFCQPYHPFEKGTIENTFQRLRRFIPKKSRLSCYSDNDISIIVDKMNNAPRKCLNWKTPNEVFFNLPIAQTFDNFNYLSKPSLNMKCCASG